MEDAFDYGEQAALFFFGADDCLQGPSSLGTGAGALGPEVEDVGTFVQQAKRVRGGRIGSEKIAAVTEGVGGNVDDAHDEGPAPDL